MTQSTTDLIERLEEAGAFDGAYDAVLCDVWGCYHDGIRPYRAAVEALRRFRAGGGTVLLLTNAPRSAARVVEFLDRIGSPRDSYDAVMSSGEACIAALATGAYGQRFHYVGPARDAPMLAEAGLTSAPLAEADAILCTGLATDEHTPDDYAEALAAWAARAVPMLCANPDVVVDRGAERLWCAGALAEAYERLGGTVTWFGKPYAPVYEQSFAALGRLRGRVPERTRVLAIGDGPATDLRGGLDFGLDVLFVTGGLAAREVGEDPEHPDAVRLQAWLNEKGLAPRYAIGRLR